MKLWRFAAPLALLASQAAAANWITVATNSEDTTTYVDKDTIRRGDDGLVYFSEATDDGAHSNEAVDCARRVIYLLRLDDFPKPVDYSDWRDHGVTVTADSVGGHELQYVCANAG